MDVFLRIDINLAALVMLGIVCTIAFRRLDLNDQLNRVFLITGIVIILELSFETITCILNHRTESWVAPVSTALHMCLFTVAPMLTYFWYLLISHWVLSDEKITRKRHIGLLIPVAVNLFFVLLSPAYGLIFYIDNGNVYHRGRLFLLSVVIIYSFFIYAFILIWKQRKKVVREEFVPLLAVGILPVIGGLLQSLFYGILLMWSCAAFSMIVVYIYLQHRMVHLDDLTGAWTRGTFEYSVEQRTKLKKDGVFGLIFLDLDGLKQINDEYGHHEGDYALRTTVQMVKSVLKKTDIIARTGGDEFLVLLDCKNREKLDQTVEMIKDIMRRYNEASDKKYRIDCSIGAEMFQAGSHDIGQLMHHVDMLMYANKRNKSLDENSEVS
jgi:diguanylate cyclase (GGDEF) domain